MENATIQSAAQLRRRLEALDEERARIVRELSAASTESPLPGWYLTVEANGFRALLPGDAVERILPLVECLPAPGLPTHVLGTMVHRGRTAHVVDLGRHLGRTTEPALESHLVLLTCARPIALAVDRVRGLIESPLLLGEGPEESNAANRLTLALCRVGEDVLPLLSLEALVALVGDPEQDE